MIKDSLCLSDNNNHFFIAFIISFSIHLIYFNTNSYESLFRGRAKQWGLFLIIRILQQQKIGLIVSLSHTHYNLIEYHSQNHNTQTSRAYIINVYVRAYVYSWVCAEQMCMVCGVAGALCASAWVHKWKKSKNFTANQFY